MSQPQRLGGEIILPRGRDTREGEKIVWTARITRMKVQKLGIKSPGDNKSIPYQRSAGAIARQVQREGVDCTVDEAQEWVDAFYDNYQKVSAFIRFCKNSVEDPGYLDTPYGRRRHFQMSSNRAAVAAQQREACNFPIQSTVADALSEALVHLYRERNRMGLQFRLVLAIHDAVIIEVPYEEARIARDLLCACLSDLAVVPNVGLHYGVDVEVFDRWNEKVSPDVLACCGL